jgi:hypothetical protein
VKAVMLGSLFVWPAIHLANRAFYSSDKHALLGAVFAYPLLGPWLDDLWRRRRMLPLLGMLAFVLFHGVVSFTIRTLTNVDLRDPIRHVASRAGPDDHVLVFCCHMAGRLVARSEGREDLLIEERRQEKWGAKQICAQDWIVANESRFKGKGSVEQRLQQAECGCEETGTFSSTSIDYTGDESIFGLVEEQMTVFACSGAEAAKSAGGR